jgi:excinuclease UvrABC ATPase subunit
VFTGISGSGKSSLAFGTLYAEAQRRYLESVSLYARRLFNQMAIPEVDEIEGLPPAVALQQQRGSASTRSLVGKVDSLEKTEVPTDVRFINSAYKFSLLMSYNYAGYIIKGN